MAAVYKTISSNRKSEKNSHGCGPESGATQISLETKVGLENEKLYLNVTRQFIHPIVQFSLFLVHKYTPF